jgi:type VI protein secretion system component Hcp
MRTSFSRVPKAAALIAVGLLGGGAAFAVASVPDSNGVYTGCVEMQTNTDSGQTMPYLSYYGNLNVIDPSAGQTCDQVATYEEVPTTDEQQITWNQTGPAGPTGPQGETGPQGPAGPAGQQGLTGAKGTTGAKGAKGAIGAKGQPGKTIDVSSSSSRSSVAAVALSEPGSSAIKGESVDTAASNAKLAFDAISVDYEASGPAVNLGSQSTGAGAGKAQPQTITITKVLDKTSPTLLAATSGRQIFKQGLIVIPTAGGKGSDLVLKLTDAVINSDRITTTKGEKPLEQLTLEVLGVKIQYSDVQSGGGTLGEPVPAGWNRVLNTADLGATITRSSRKG